MTDILMSGDGSEPDPPKFPDSSAVLSNLTLVFTVSFSLCLGMIENIRQLSRNDRKQTTAV